LGDLLLLGVTIALEPLPIIGFILVLSTPRGPRNGLGFIGGWLVCLVAIVLAAAALDGGKPLAPSSQPSTAASAATILFGAGLALYGLYRQLHPHTGPPKEPSWAKKLDQIGPGGAAVIGVLLQPWALAAAGGVRVLQQGLSEAWSILAAVLFVLVSTSVLAGMEIFALLDPDRARDRLGALRDWLSRHRDRAIVILSLVAGIYLIVRGATEIW
jgi:hypothetical protein